jgi:hypothetical protein
MAKRRLKLPQNFSFTPAEIGQFVIAKPHERHVIAFSVAEQIFRSLQGC